MKNNISKQCAVLIQRYKKPIAEVIATILFISAPDFDAQITFYHKFIQKILVNVCVRSGAFACHSICIIVSHIAYSITVLKGVPIVFALFSTGWNGYGDSECRKPASIWWHWQRTEAAVWKSNLEQRPWRNRKSISLCSGIYNLSDTLACCWFVVWWWGDFKLFLIEHCKAWKEDGSHRGVERRKCGGKAWVCSCKGNRIFNIYVFAIVTLLSTENNSTNNYGLRSKQLATQVTTPHSVQIVPSCVVFLPVVMWFVSYKARGVNGEQLLKLVFKSNSFNWWTTKETA